MLGVGATGTNLTMQIVWGGRGVTGGTFSNVQLEAENVHNLPGELQLLAAKINFMGEIC